MKKKLIYVALLLVAVAVAAGAIFFLTPAKWKADTGKLRKAFATAPVELTAEVNKAIVPIKAGKFAEGVTILCNLVDKGGLSAEQKQAIKDTLVDMQVIELQKPSADSATVLQAITDCDSKL